MGVVNRSSSLLNYAYFDYAYLDYAYLDYAYRSICLRDIVSVCGLRHNKKR